MSHIDPKCLPPNLSSTRTLINTKTTTTEVPSPAKTATKVLELILWLTSHTTSSATTTATRTNTGGKIRPRAGLVRTTRLEVRGMGRVELIKKTKDGNQQYYVSNQLKRVSSTLKSILWCGVVRCYMVLVTKSEWWIQRTQWKLNN